MRVASSMQVNGYHARYLEIQLGSTAPFITATSHPIPESVLRKYLGGSGLGAWILLRHDAPTMEPHEGPLAFVFSPLVGSPLTTSAKFAVVCRSPLTGRFNDALASSGFAIS